MRIPISHVRLALLLPMLIPCLARGQDADRTAAYDFSRRMGAGNNYMAAKVVGGYAAPEDFQLLRRHRFTHCRIGYKAYNYCDATAPYTIDPARMSQLKDAVDDCLAEGLVAIVDPIHYWAYVGDVVGPYEDAHLPMLVSLWEQIAAAFADYPLDTVAFEIMNEPHGATDLDAIVTNCLAAIRGVAGNESRICIVSGTGFSTREALIRAFDDDVFPTDDHFLVGTFHYYDPKTFTKQGDDPSLVYWADGGSSDSDFDVPANNLDEVAAANHNWADRHGVVPLPIYMGEFGCDNKAPQPDRMRWISWLRFMAEERGFSWAHWNMYRDDDASKGMGPWNSLEKTDPSKRSFQAYMVEGLLTHYEAEEGAFSGGTAAASDGLGYSGTGYVSFPAGAVGSDVHVTVACYVPRDDSYAAVIRYSSDVDRELTFQTLDYTGGLIQERGVIFPTTGGLSDWASTSVTCDFSATTSTLVRLIADSAPGPKIDWIKITKGATGYVFPSDAIAYDTFEDGPYGEFGWVDAEWTTTGSTSVVDNPTLAYQGDFRLRLSESASARRTVDLSSVDAAMLSFYWRANGLGGAGDAATVEIYDGQWRQVLLVQDGEDDNIWHFARIDLSGYDMASDFQVRFGIQGGGSSRFHIDQVEIIEAPGASGLPWRRY
jgi:endoglucanase